jgi:hypothetical protein
VYSAAGDSSSAALYFVYHQFEVSKLFIMKIIANIIVSHLAFLAFFGGVAFAFAFSPAEDPVASPPPPTTEMGGRADMTEKRKEMAVDKVVERRAELTERSQDRIINLAANMSNRIDAAITRMQNIIDRITSRIEKLEGSDLDTVTATNALASAQLSIDAAKEAMVIIDSEVSFAVESEDVRNQWQSVRAMYIEIHNHLKTAYSEIKASIAALKTTRTQEMPAEAVPAEAEIESEVTSQ